MALRTDPTAPARQRRAGTRPGIDAVRAHGTAGCPKRMTHGPCGGVRGDGGCELGDRRCSFVDLDGQGSAGVRSDAVVRPPVGSSSAPAPGAVSGESEVPGALGAVPPGPAALTPAARDLAAIMARRPIVVADLPSSGPDADELRRAAAALAGHVDAALLGDAPWARVQLPPSLRAAIAGAEGVRAWAGLNCRDRNRVALEGELAGLVAAGAAAVHCVTGDHPALGDRADAPGVFDLDAVGLTRLAAGSGLLVSAAESPSAPPVDRRPARAALKAGAGAHVVIVNHAGAQGELEAFVAATRALVPDLRVLVSIPLACSAAGTVRLRAFLPDAGPSPGALGTVDVAAAVRRAVAEAERALAIPGVAGVDLSGVAGPGEELAVARALSTVGCALGAGA